MEKHNCVDLIVYTLMQRQSRRFLIRERLSWAHSRRRGDVDEETSFGRDNPDGPQLERHRRRALI